MEQFLVSQGDDRVELKVICVGIGGAGCNVIEYMFTKALVGIDLIAIDTNTESLAQINDVNKIHISSNIEDSNEIRTALEGADIVFILAGLGGETGTNASPIVAQIAKKVGAFTISIVAKPFILEGRKKIKLAESGLEELKRESDSTVVIPNDKLLSTIDKKLGFKDSFKITDSVLAEAVSVTAGIILSNDISLDFADLKTVMGYKGMALMGVGEHEGGNAANEAIKAAIESPLLDDISINGAMGILVHFNTHPDFPFMDTSEAMIIVQENSDEDAHVIWGTTTDSSLNKNYVKVTIILAGFEQKNNVANNSNYEG